MHALRRAKERCVCVGGGGGGGFIFQSTAAFRSSLQADTKLLGAYVLRARGSQRLPQLGEAAKGAAVLNYQPLFMLAYKSSNCGFSLCTTHRALLSGRL